MSQSEPPAERPADQKHPDLERLRAAWEVAADALHSAERAAEAAAAIRAERDAQSRFIAVLAHELKNPLNAIYGYAQLLRQPELPTDAAGKTDKLATIETAAKHLIGLVGDILTSEQIESGNLEIDTELFEVAPLIEDVAALERASIEANGNNLILLLPPDSGSITSDRRRVAQILINLLSNAAKFTHKGEVAVTVVRDEDNSLRLTVTDTGSGIAPARKAQLFEAFSAIGGKESRQAGGHGLGLYITAGLVDRLSGSISVDSEVGKGTRISVWLPDLRTQRQTERPGEFELLTMGFTQSLPALDPLLQQVDADSFLIGSVFECLTEIGEDGYARPCLARSWQQIDPRTWMFRLDRTARFQNGDPLTSADVLATFRRVRRMLDDTACEMQSTAPDLEACEAANDHTVVLRSRAPAPLFLEQLAAIPIIHRAAGDLPVGAFDLAHAIGTGPYRMVDYGPHGLRLVAHHRTGKQPARWKVVIGRGFRTAAEAEEALLSGRVDVTPHVGRALARKLERGSAIRILRPQRDCVFFLQPNILPGARGMAWLPDGTPIDANPLSDVRVRRALSLAIDRAFLVDKALMGGGKILGSPVPPHFFGADRNLLPDPYDPELARHLLATAGYPDGFALATAAIDDVESDDRQLLRALTVQLATAGIHLKPNYGPLRDFARYDPQPSFGLLLTSWVPFLPDAEMILRDFAAAFDPEHGFGACNYGLIAIPEIDQAVRRAARSLDRSERGRLLKEACRAIAHECLLIPLVQQIECLACRGHLDIAGRYHLWTRPDQVVLRDAEMLLFDQLLAE
ncbi:ABC transporter substrate-binding protein [Dongia deserti]|uniref:ABC transporter substrate-binding protein n=1 Tax=Dongia deserti TaxID=2268030 RepID=UPI0013C44BE5|nr:ABC transporter substrate-binding protein [Dongia deserti]